jgi:hypothetical protein
MRKAIFFLPVLIAFLVLLSSCNTNNPTESLIQEMISSNDVHFQNPTEIVKDLMISPDKNVGKLYIWSDSRYVYVKYISTTAYTFKNLHLAVYPYKNQIPVTDGSPSLEKYPYIFSNLPLNTKEYTFKLDFNGISQNDVKFYVSAQADLSLNPSATGEKGNASAWSEGMRFEGCDNFSTYFLFSNK